MLSGILIFFFFLFLLSAGQTLFHFVYYDYPTRLTATANVIVRKKEFSSTNLILILFFNLILSEKRQCFEIEEARAGMFCPPYEQLYFLDWKEMITMRPVIETKMGVSFLFAFFPHFFHLFLFFLKTEVIGLGVCARESIFSVVS